MKFITRDPKKLARSKTWTACIWAAAGTSFTVAAILRKSQRDWQLALAALYFALALLNLYSAKKYKNSISKNIP